MFQVIISYAQIIISVLLTLAILAQNRTGGLSATFGGSGSFQASKRGADKVLSQATIVLAILFAVNSLAFLFV